MIEIREFKSEDFSCGYIETISEVWPCNDITEETLSKVLDKNVYIFVAENNGEVIGSLSLYIQNKFIHNGSCVGFIEEVVVRKKYNGKNIGSLLVERAVKRCEELGCYKVLLYCYDDLVQFYERNGFEVFKQKLMGKQIGVKNEN
tara:strand:- start:53 stop:487 length:435 start_codon:yes stop_codon:yes gene_type:complete